MRILLSLDGSEKDERALQVAQALGELTAGEIHLVRVADVPATQPSFGMALVGLTSSTEEFRADIERSLRNTAERVSSVSRPRRNVTWEVIDGVDVARALLRRAEAGADVIVMATRAPGAVERAFLGSVADAVVLDASCPVIVVPPGALYASGQRIGLQRALVPLDGSQRSLTVVDRMLELLPARSIEYVLMQAVHVESMGGYMTPDPVLPVLPGTAASPAHVIHVQAEQAEQHLNDVAARLRYLGQRASVVVSESGDPAAAIVEAIRGELVDFIAMATHGSGGVRRMLLGSVANRVVRKSEVPVLLVTPRSSEPRER